MHWPEHPRPTAKVAESITNSKTHLKLVLSDYIVAQANLQRKKLATTELMMDAQKRGTMFALIQEPDTGARRKMKTHNGTRTYQNNSDTDGTVKAAVVVFNPDVTVTQLDEFTTNNIVVVKIETMAWEVYAISFYFEPDSPINNYLGQLTKVCRELGLHRIIIWGDANAKSMWWGSPKSDKRGENMVETLIEMDMQVLNNGNIPTFDRLVI